LLLLPLLSHSIPAFAANLQAPTPEELQMTSQPEVPGADAVILNIEETASDREETASAFDIDSAGKRNFHSVYIRMKILTEAGRRYADVAIPNVGGLFSLGEVQGRTIQTDGSIVPLTAKPLIKNYEAVFAMPNVQVASIIEYRYFLRYDGRLNIAPEWYIQRELFIRAGKYYFRVNGQDKINGRGEISGGAAYSSNLPKGTAVKYIRSENAFELVVHNVPPLPREEFMPPVQSLSYRVLFYYTEADTESDYWQSEGRSWAKDVDKFISSSKLKDAVSHLVSAGDSDQQKVAKIYEAVMKLENTSFTREHSAAENKAAGIRTKNADDIWEAKRGTADQITLLFVAMVRAAGLQAFSMDVTNRDRAVFVSSFLDKDQLDDEIAIVRIDGKEQFFDPGQRYCAFGQLHWKHTVTQGLREMNGITAIAKTPSASAAQAQTSRVANLDLAR
jgi:hypothetical protein